MARDLVPDPQHPRGAAAGWDAPATSDPARPDPRPQGGADLPDRRVTAGPRVGGPPHGHQLPLDADPAAARGPTADQGPEMAGRMRPTHPRGATAQRADRAVLPMADGRRPAVPDA